MTGGGLFKALNHCERHSQRRKWVREEIELDARRGEIRGGTQKLFREGISVAIVAARVGAKTGRAFKLMRQGRERDAVLVVRQCVDVLVQNDYHRSPALEAALASSVLTLEELALRLGTAGASRELVREAADFYRTLGDGVDGAPERADWLEWRMKESASGGR